MVAGTTLSTSQARRAHKARRDGADIMVASALRWAETRQAVSRESGRGTTTRHPGTEKGIGGEHSLRFPSLEPEVPASGRKKRFIAASSVGSSRKRPTRHPYHRATRESSGPPELVVPRFPTARPCLSWTQLAANHLSFARQSWLRRSGYVPRTNVTTC